jgi:hypothetical protein
MGPLDDVGDVVSAAALVAYESKSPLGCRGRECRSNVGQSNTGFTLPFCVKCFAKLRSITRVELVEAASASVYDVDAVSLAVRRMRDAQRELEGRR